MGGIDQAKPIVSVHNANLSPSEGRDGHMAHRKLSKGRI